MEPRYGFPAAAALVPSEARFLGGVARYDLWYGGDGRLIRIVWGHTVNIVWGHTVNDWDSYNTRTTLYYHNEPGRPQGEDLELILKYICLFAPDAAQELGLAED